MLNQSSLMEEVVEVDQVVVARSGPVVRLEELAGSRHSISSTPEATSRSTMRCSAGLTTDIWQVGHRKT